MRPLAPNANQMTDPIVNNSSDTDYSDTDYFNKMMNFQPIIESKIIYSIGNLKSLRHSKKKAPALQDRSIFRAISRDENNSTTSNRYHSEFLSHELSTKQQEMLQYREQLMQRHVATANIKTIIDNDKLSNGINYYTQQRRNFQNSREQIRVNRPNEGNNKIRISIKGEVNLRKSENAWRPSFLAKTPAIDNTAPELYRQVRSILNKLTAQNFEIMLGQFKELQIDTNEKLNNVINLVFNKAVNEPNFSTGYAHLCKHLSTCSAQIEISPAENSFFKRTLITKCQQEFEQNVANKNSIETALAPLTGKLKMCTLNGDSSSALEIKEQIIEEEANVRRSLVCTVRFIGELYKLDMLTTSIMNVCIKSLVDSRTDEKLECVCKLLTTVGEKLERKPIDDAKRAKAQYLDLSSYMRQFKQIIDRKGPNAKVSTRIRFMLMDVIELRANQWRPKK